jgi:hypothetical protein
MGIGHNASCLENDIAALISCTSRALKQNCEAFRWGSLTMTGAVESSLFCPAGVGVYCQVTNKKLSRAVDAGELGM